MTAIQTLETQRDEVENLCRRYRVARLRLFGSSVRDDWDPETSDFDFLAEFSQPPAGMNGFKQLFGFSAELEALLGRPVDVVDWAAARKPHFRAAAEAGALEWYAA